MCGIGGVVVAPGAEVDPTWLDGMVRAMRHRGPDDEGTLLWAPEAHTRAGPHRVGLAHTRLSILDLSAAGHQPMADADGRLQLVFNGEIYNYVELRLELAALGHRFRSGTDTEVLLAAYREWGERALPRLVGMFAFAVLDSERDELFLARDFFGIKPLLYTTWTGGFAFASELGSLLELPTVSRRVDPAMLYDYLRFGLVDHDARTLVADVRRVPPGHFARVPLEAPSRPTVVEYWRPTDVRRDVSFESAAGDVRSMFLDNVRLHLRSDVPVGAALSGGIDSSAIVAAMREVAGADAVLNSFSYLADDPRLDEESWVDLVADSAGAKVHKVRLEAAELVRDLDALIVAQGEPFASTSIYAQYRVFGLAAEARVPVMLDGQGADELFAGYRGYLAGRFASLVRAGRMGSALRLAVGVARLPDSGVSVRDIAKAAWYLVPQRMRLPLRRMVSRAETVPPWMDAGWFAERNVAPATWSERSSGGFREARRAALTSTSLPALLRYEDRNSMAHSVESRVPFLTPAFVDYVVSLPDQHLIDGQGVSKAVFRRAMRGLVPDAVLDRRDKIGFAPPERAWLDDVEPWVTGVLSADRSGEVRGLRIPEVRARWAATVSGGRRLDGQVWRWINTIRWAELLDVDFD